MSLAIDDRHITGLFAFGQWFKVKKGSVCIDAYEFVYWDENPEPGKEPNPYKIRHTYYEMGAVYNADRPGLYKAERYEKTLGGWENPSGHTGIGFIDADTNERVSFALLEVKAFREACICK